MRCALKKLSCGSILAYSLILLGIVLVASLGMFQASVTNLRSVSTNDKSMQAFQIADSGSQAVVKMLKNATGSNIGDPSLANCSGGTDAVVEVDSPNFLGGGYRVIFQDSDGKTLKCNANISEVASVKSVGTYADTARAVEVAVAQSPAPGITGGCRLSGTTISEIWGVGCKTSGPASSASCDGAKDNSTSVCGLSGLPSGPDMVCVCVKK